MNQRYADRLTAAEIGEYLEYDAASGALIWRKAMSSRAKQGSVAGADVRFCEQRVYRQVGLLGKKYYGHVLAWLLATGHWPSHEIDHIDGDGLNNAFANLRDVPHAINCQNVRRPQRTSLTGIQGVKRVAGGFSARIKLNGVRLHLGTFHSSEDAHQAYLNAKRKLHPGCTI